MYSLIPKVGERRFKNALSAGAGMYFPKDDPHKLNDFPLTPEEIDMAVRIYESGLTVQQMAKRLSDPINTVHKVLPKQVVNLRSRSTLQAKGNR